MVINMKDNTKKVGLMEKANINGHQEVRIKDNLNKGKDKVMASGLIQMGQNIQGNLKMMQKTVMVHKYTKQVKNLLEYLAKAVKKMENFIIRKTSKFKLL